MTYFIECPHNMHLRYVRAAQGYNKGIMVTDDPLPRMKWNTTLHRGVYFSWIQLHEMSLGREALHKRG